MRGAGIQTELIGPNDAAGAPGLTIGAVCDALRAEFADISISKLRYLEDRNLVTPRRTSGGYRLYGPRDVERLRTVLRLQRDEFLPLKVIREELDSGHVGTVGLAKQSRLIKRENLGSNDPGRTYDIEEVLAASGADRALVKALGQYGLVSGTDWFDESDREVITAAVELRAYGLEPRHLRTLRVAAEREAGLLEQVLSTGLRSPNPDRRNESMEALKSVAALASHVRHLMLVQELRRVVTSIGQSHPEKS
ncbi:MAG: MerR family transcriptional regulator [Thermoleophilia bacterium]|nr:MerR family transcriptional regulator [Thermoleophilia bacterium]